MPNYTFDTHNVDRIEIDLSNEIDEIRNMQVELDIDRSPSKDRAEVSRRLLRARDLAEALGAELGHLYWSFKGYEDPRDYA